MHLNVIDAFIHSLMFMRMHTPQLETSQVSQGLLYRNVLAPSMRVPEDVVIHGAAGHYLKDSLLCSDAEQDMYSAATVSALSPRQGTPDEMRESVQMGATTQMNQNLAA